MKFFRNHTFIAAICLLSLFITGLLNIFGVSLKDTLIYFSYEIIYIFLPGILIYNRFFYQKDYSAVNIVFGWSLGYIIEIFFYIVLSAVNLKFILFFYPAILLVFYLYKNPKKTPMVIIIRKNSHQILIITWLIMLTLILLSLGFYLNNPLPDHIVNTDYNVDIVRTMSLTAETLQHWPTTEPSVSQTSYYYHMYVSYHLAAISYITRLSIPLVYLRLHLIPLLILLVISLYAFGLKYANNSRIGIITIVFTLFLGEIDISTVSESPFFYLLFTNLFLSSSFLLGIIFFIPAVILINKIFLWPQKEIKINHWILLLIFLIAAAGTKGAILPLLLAALGIVNIINFIQYRPNFKLILCFFLMLSVFFYFWFFIYRFSSLYPNFSPFRTFYRMDFIKSIDNYIKVHADTVYLRYLLPFIYMLISLIGILNIKLYLIYRALLKYKYRIKSIDLWLYLMFIIGISCLILFNWPGGDQVYFFFYGMIALTPILARYFYSYIGEISEGKLLIHSRKNILLIILLILLVLDLPLDYSKKQNNNQGNLLTNNLYRGLIWIKNNTSPDSIIAVNNYYIKPGIPRYHYYSAFSERRIFLEGWFYSNKARQLVNKINSAKEQPFLDRFTLNENIFNNGDYESLMILKQKFNVSYLLNDKIHRKSTVPAKGLELLFSNEDIDIYQII